MGSLQGHISTTVLQMVQQFLQAVERHAKCPVGIAHNCSSRCRFVRVKSHLDKLFALDWAAFPERWVVDQTARRCQGGLFKLALRLGAQDLRGIHSAVLVDEHAQPYHPGELPDEGILRINERRHAAWAGRRIDFAQRKVAYGQNRSGARRGRSLRWYAVASCRRGAVLLLELYGQLSSRRAAEARQRSLE